MHPNNSSRRHGRWVLPALALLTAAGWLGNHTLTTNSYLLESARLPAAFSGFRIVQISDLHGASFGKANARLIDAVSKAAPDLIALTGDLADEYTDLSTLPDFLRALRAIAPVFYVTGNHEWVMPASSRKRLFSMLEEAGILLLRNDFHVLTRQGARLVIAGMDDPNGPADQKSPETLLAQIRAQEGDDACILLLAHRNDQLSRWSSLHVDFVLSGHAHGGIVRLPLLGPVFGTHYELFPKDTAGVCTEGNTAMLVSRGLGPSHRIPVRVGNPPEIAVAILGRSGAEA